jgi:transcriptional regulator with XRE-family HTH domain
MTNQLGARIAEARRSKGLSQRELGELLHRSESWVSQVERGVLKVERLALLRRIAEALDVGFLDLQPGLVETEPESTAALNSALDGLRLALTGHPALLTVPGDRATPVRFEDLAAQVDRAWDAALVSDFTPLAELLPVAEAATRRARIEDRIKYLLLLTRLYQAVSFSFAYENEADAAWVAADRAIFAAEATGDPLQIIASHFRLAHTLIRLGRYDQARHLAGQAIEALRPRATDDAEHQVLALFGAMHLVRAVLAGIDQNRQEVRETLDEAERLAQIVGDDRNDFNTEFGTTNVKLHRVAIALDLGDAGEALDVARTADPAAMSTERQMRFYLDIARAHTQRRQIDQAIEALTAAEAIQPETFRSHKVTLQVIDDLTPLAIGKSQASALDNLTRRIGARL